MNKTFSDIVKFVSCILLFLHHFYLGHPLVVPLGYIGCSVFFFLSVYGVGKSQDKKQLGLWAFLKRRLSRVYIPLLSVNLLFVLLTVLLQKNALVVPIYHVACDYLTIQTVDGFGQTILYVLDVWQMDSVTWFIHVLLLVYLFVWLVQQIREWRLYAAIVIGSFILTEALLVYFKAESWYMIDLTGVVLGLLVYKLEPIIERHRTGVVNALLLLMFLVTVLVTMVCLDSLRPLLVLLFGFSYSGAAVLLFYSIGKKYQLSPNKAITYWGGGYLSISI